MWRNFAGLGDVGFKILPPDFIIKIYIMIKLGVPFKGAKLQNMSQGFSQEHQANDWASYFGQFLVAPFNAKILVIRGVQNPQDIVVGDNSFLEGGCGIRLQSIEDPTLSMVYWHCQDVFPVNVGDRVFRGEPVAMMGNTGFVYSGGQYVSIDRRLIPPYPGTHVHWTMGINNADGTYTALDPHVYIDYNLEVSFDLLTTIQQLIKKIQGFINGK